MFSLTRLTIRRARQERLLQAAGSLTFTTLLSIVPFLAVSFALFMRFPMFTRFEADLRKAIQNLRERPHRLDHCMQAMRMTTVPKALLWKRIKALEPPA